MDPRLEKERLFNAVYIEEDVLATAREIFAESKRKLSLSSSVITSIMVSMCHVVFTRAPEQGGTLAVKLAGDGNPILMINPDFLGQIGADQAVFGFAHEAYHLIMMHLHTDPGLRNNPNWVTATEACINYRVKNHMDKQLIQIDGKTVIVDPDKVYEQYRNGAKSAGFTPVSKEDFYKTDMGCLAELDRLPKPPQPKNNTCVHSDPDAGDGSSGSGAPLDQSEVDKFMDKVLQGAIQEAKNGRPKAAEEILGFMDSAPEASKIWGDLGAGVLRGETARSRKTDMWERWTADIIGSKMTDGNRLRYNKKVPWDPRVTAWGKQPKKHGAVFVDASGSMHQDVLDKVAALISDLEEIEIEWHSFDGEVWPFNAGEGFRGGGGTSFQIIDDHVQQGGYKKGSQEECCEEDMDFVLVITDGYAPHIVPVDPDIWIWLIVPGGDSWPESAGMSCRQIDLP